MSGDRLGGRILLGRVGDSAAPGVERVLVDRLWPRGVRKDAGLWDVWLKEAAPSSELRKWYHHDPEHWEEFRSRYRAELADEAHRSAVSELLGVLREARVMLLTHARFVERSHLAVLAEVLAERVPDA